ncbi:MAG: metal-sensitive transcriptional regulator, partial [Luminiphilus sp.]
MRDETQRKADARLARIEGQIRAVRKMVTEDRYCIDVVRQVQAARSALSSLETLIIGDTFGLIVFAFTTLLGWSF